MASPHLDQTADLHDSRGGVTLLRASLRPWLFLSRGFADQAYQGERVGTATAVAVKIIRPQEGQKSFRCAARWWVIERTFGWLVHCRRLNRDHEATPSSALAFFVLAAAMILVSRLARTLCNEVCFSCLLSQELRSKYKLIFI